MKNICVNRGSDLHSVVQSKRFPLPQKNTLGKAIVSLLPLKLLCNKNKTSTKAYTL